KTPTIGVDGSKGAEQASNKSVCIAKGKNATFILSHIVDRHTFATAEAYDKSSSARARKYAEDLLNDSVKIAKEDGVENVELVIKYGCPKVAITKEIAPENDADLIIVGATGLNAVERFLIGSVSESVARYSKCDVLIIR